MTAHTDAVFDPSPYRALSFDCYGTLIDWETGLLQALQPWAAWRDVDRTAEELLQCFARNEHQVQQDQPTAHYPAVLAATLRRVAAELGGSATDAECEAFGASVGTWPAFPDTARALRRLKRRFRLIILSNIDRTSFAASNRRLGVEFDLIVTAEDVGSYKPALAHFHALFEQLPALGLQAGQVLHVAQSLFHDHQPAQALGMPSVWIDRRHDRAGSGATPAVDVAVHHRFTSLASFADAALADGPEHPEGRGAQPAG